MGKWDRRWISRRRYNSKKYRDYDYEEPPPSPPSPHHPQSNPPPIQDSGSSWEIDFCKSVRVPWKKVVAVKHYMYCYENVAKWDDSASVEAFHDAKKRYWEKINCLPYETPLPDKDMYIDEINWNPDIDPKLISDLDQEYFILDEVGKGDTLQMRVEMGNIAIPVCAPVQNNENPDGELPGEDDAAQRVGSVNDAMLHWSQNTKSTNSKDVMNPWEQSYTIVDKSSKNNVWKGSAGESAAQKVRTCWVQNANSKDVSNPWEQSWTQFDDPLRNNPRKGTACEGPAQEVGTYWDLNANSGNFEDVNNPWEQNLTQFGKSLSTNAWKSYAGAYPPQGVRTHWGQDAKSINSKDVSNSWEQNHTQFNDSLKNNACSASGSPAQRVRNQWGQNADSMNSKDVNPRVQIHTPVDESLRNNVWKGCTEDSWRGRKDSTFKSWSTDDNKSAGDKGWTHIDDRSRGRKQWNINSHEQQYPVNIGNTWQRNFSSDTGVSWGSRGSTEYGNKSRGWKQPEIQNKQPRNTNYKGPFGGRRPEQSGWRKREGSLQHSSRYKTSRFQGDDYMTAQK